VPGEDISYAELGIKKELALHRASGGGLAQRDNLLGDRELPAA
jgi:hypothetical protein